MSVCVYICVWMHTLEATGTHLLCPLQFTPLRDLSVSLELSICSARPVTHMTQWSSYLQCQDYRYGHHAWLFIQVMGIQIQVLVPEQQTFLPTEPFLQPPLFNFFYF